jgi:hypothetical protein
MALLTGRAGAGLRARSYPTLALAQWEPEGSALTAAN